MQKSILLKNIMPITDHMEPFWFSIILDNF